MVVVVLGYPATANLGEDSHCLTNLGAKILNVTDRSGPVNLGHQIKNLHSKATFGLDQRVIYCHGTRLTKVRPILPARPSTYAWEGNTAMAAGKRSYLIRLRRPGSPIPAPRTAQEQREPK